MIVTTATYLYFRPARAPSTASAQQNSAAATVSEINDDAKAGARGSITGKLPASYLVTQLQNFKDGKRDNPIMTPMVAPLSPQDIAEVAASYGTQVSGAAAHAAVKSAGSDADLPRSELVPYGESPFDKNRVDVLHNILAKLEAQGFHGVLTMTSSPGMFCLTGNAADGFIPAAPSLPASRCDLIGNPFMDSPLGHQSLAFSNQVLGVRVRTAGRINVVTENATAPRNPAPYPARSDSLTAGEWNRAATANNRVEYAVEPAQ